MLLNFNALSRGRYETTQQDFKKHTVLLASMKKDLDAVFKRIRFFDFVCSQTDSFSTQRQLPSFWTQSAKFTMCCFRIIKGKLGKQYPDAFKGKTFLLPWKQQDCNPCGIRALASVFPFDRHSSLSFTFVSNSRCKQNIWWSTDKPWRTNTCILTKCFLLHSLQWRVQFDGGGRRRRRNNGDIRSSDARDTKNTHASRQRRGRIFNACSHCDCTKRRQQLSQIRSDWRLHHTKLWQGQYFHNRGGVWRHSNIQRRSGHWEGIGQFSRNYLPVTSSDSSQVGYKCWTSFFFFFFAKGIQAARFCGFIWIQQSGRFAPWKMLKQNVPVWKIVNRTQGNVLAPFR